MEAVAVSELRRLEDNMSAKVEVAYMDEVDLGGIQDGFTDVAAEARC